MHPILLSIATHFAVFKWMDGEKRAVEDVQDLNRALQDVFGDWLTVWRVGRGMPMATRINLANHLQERREVIVGDLQQGQQNLPAIVECEVAELIQQDITNHQETSLMSKFVFSLRPDIGAPIDQYVRKGIRLYQLHYQGYRDPAIGPHDYTTYFGLFNEFCENELQNAELIQQFQPIFAADFMDENIFIRRTADKYLWLLGTLPMDDLQAWGVIQP